MVAPAGHPLVVGIQSGQPDLVALTAGLWAECLGGVPLHFCYADPTRVVDEEFADGNVRHSPLASDVIDDSWLARRDTLTAFLTNLLHGRGLPWELHYTAGRADRALTHLARAVDASMILVGS